MFKVQLQVQVSVPPYWTAEGTCVCFFPKDGQSQLTLPTPEQFQPTLSLLIKLTQPVRPPQPILSTSHNVIFVIMGEGT